MATWEKPRQKLNMRDLSRDLPFLLNESRKMLRGTSIVPNDSPRSLKKNKKRDAIRLALRKREYMPRGTTGEKFGIGVGQLNFHIYDR